MKIFKVKSNGKVYNVKANDAEHAIKLVKTLVKDNIKVGQRVKWDTTDAHGQKFAGEGIVIEAKNFAGMIVVKYDRTKYPEMYRAPYNGTAVVKESNARVIDSVKDAHTISPWAISRGDRILSEDGDKATVISMKGDRRHGYDVVVKLDNGSTDTWYYMPDDVVTLTDSVKDDEIVKKIIVSDSVNENDLEKAILKLSKDALQEIAYPGLRGPVGCPKYELQDDVINGAGFDALLKGNKSHPEAKRIIEELNDRHIKVKGVTDSFRDAASPLQTVNALLEDERAAVDAYNVALENLKGKIPDESYEAIEAIRNDENRHIENLQAVVNGNVTEKNLEDSVKDAYVEVPLVVNQYEINALRKIWFNVEKTGREKDGYPVYRLTGDREKILYWLKRNYDRNFSSSDIHDSYVIKKNLTDSTMEDAVKNNLDVYRSAIKEAVDELQKINGKYNEQDKVLVQSVLQKAAAAIARAKSNYEKWI